MITCQDQKTEVKATPFKIADETPITSIIEQNNFTNESLHVIGQQLDRIEEKIVEWTIEKQASEKSVFVKDIGFGFPTNLLIWGKSFPKTFVAEAEEIVSESVFSSEIISFLEIIQAARVLVEVPSVLTFKLESIFSTISRVLDWEVLNITFSLWLGKSIKGFSVL